MLSTNRDGLQKSVSPNKEICKENEEDKYNNKTTIIDIPKDIPKDIPEDIKLKDFLCYLTSTEVSESKRYIMR